MTKEIDIRRGRHCKHQVSRWIVPYIPALQGEEGVNADVRFENEAQWIRDNGGVVVHIQRPGAATVSAHASEAGVAIAEGDVLVVNDGSLDELYNNVDNIIQNK